MRGGAADAGWRRAGSYSEALPGTASCSAPQEDAPPLPVQAAKMVGLARLAAPRRGPGPARRVGRARASAFAGGVQVSIPRSGPGGWPGLVAVAAPVVTLPALAARVLAGTREPACRPGRAWRWRRRDGERPAWWRWAAAPLCGARGFACGRGRGGEGRGVLGARGAGLLPPVVRLTAGEGLLCLSFI